MTAWANDNAGDYWRELSGKDTRVSTNRNRVLQEMRLDDWRYDPWGTGMSWLGSVCDYALVSGWEILPECGYRPGAFERGGVDLSFNPLVGWDEPVTEAELVEAQRILSRYIDWVVAAGRSY
jgi:hypothetical protein